MKAIYPDNGNGDPEPDPEAVPAVRPETGGDIDVTSFTLEVDGEMFALRPGGDGGTDYTWLSEPNSGYGFSMSPTPNLSLDEHREHIRDFLRMVDPTTGYIEDDLALGGRQSLLVGGPFLRWRPISADIGRCVPSLSAA